MIGESVAILAVILVMMIMALRQGKRPLVILSLPLMIIPAVYLIGEALLWTLRNMTALPISTLRMVAVAVGWAVGTVACILTARALISKRARALYLALALIYMTALSIAYYVHIY